jgi:hypothetical protein
MMPASGAAEGTVSVMRVGDFDFTFVETLAPQRDAAANILEVNLQATHAKAAKVPLHKYGHGTFCKFRISVPNGSVRVYALVADVAVRYIGECDDLARRYNMGYGSISPRNCYDKGQPTNSKLNRWVLGVMKAGGRVDLYFYPTLERHRVEAELIARYSPPLNGRGTLLSPARQ